MDEELIEEMIEAPIICEDTTEYDNRIVDDSEMELDEEPEDQEDQQYRCQPEETEREFARFERNYRARRIRELTLAPVRRVKAVSTTQEDSIAA